MGTVHPFPATSATSLSSALLRVYSAAEIADAIEVLIDVLDALSGDPDCEDDDPAGQCDEDGINTGSSKFCLHGTHFDGPGCPIADAGHVPIYGIDQTRGPVGMP